MRRKAPVLLVIALMPAIAAAAATSTDQISQAQKQTNPSDTTHAPELPAQFGTDERSPFLFRIGGASFTPIGFVDFTAVYRSTNAGSGIGTSFGSIPFNAALPSGGLSEMRFSSQNSRIGLDIGGNPTESLKLRAYLEADFLGNSANTLEVTGHSNTMRMRLYWIDVHWGKWEILGGQSWSLMTPGREGISPMPSDIFYTQNMDTNYQVGLVWLRTPGIRIVWRPGGNWSLGLALEDPQQYTGGLVTFPAGFDPSQVDDAGGNAKAPNIAPDGIAKVAYDTTIANRALHLEAAGLYRVFCLSTPATNVNVTRSGGGASTGLNFELVKGLRLIGTGFWSDGGGRYIFGLAPDLAVKVDQEGSFTPSPIHAGSGIAGFELQANPKTILYGYYGGVYVSRNFQQVSSDPHPTFTGYGYPDSSGLQNRSIQEATLGVIRTLWKKHGYGDLKLITQASYLSRNPWSNVTTPNNARSAHLGMAYVDLRYDLP